MSRRRIAFITMTALSAVSFLVDRFLLGEPAPAEAAATVRPKATRKVTPTPAVAKDGDSVFDPSLPYLDRLPEAGGSRDVFSMSSEMLLYYKTAEEAQEQLASQAGARPGSPEEFSNTHELEGTSRGPQGPIAVISSEPLRVGEQIDGFEVVRIDSYGVELRRGREHVLLLLPQPGADKNKSGKNSAAQNKRTTKKPAH